MKANSLHFNPKFRDKGHGLRLTESVPLRVSRELFAAAAADRRLPVPGP
jgi:hypothetical protein